MPVISWMLPPRRMPAKMRNSETRVQGFFPAVVMPGGGSSKFKFALRVVELEAPVFVWKRQCLPLAPACPGV